MVSVAGDALQTLCPSGIGARNRRWVRDSTVLRQGGNFTLHAPCIRWVVHRARNVRHETMSDFATPTCYGEALGGRRGVMEEVTFYVVFPSHLIR